MMNLKMIWTKISELVFVFFSPRYKLIVDIVLKMCYTVYEVGNTYSMIGG